MRKTNFIIVAAAIPLLSFFFAGCKKDSAPKSPNAVTNGLSAKSTAADSMVLTPEGAMPASQVHLIENGYHLELKGGHVLKVETRSGRLAADFGLLKPL